MSTNLVPKKAFIATVSILAKSGTNNVSSNKKMDK